MVRSRKERLKSGDIGDVLYYRLVVMQLRLRLARTTGRIFLDAENTTSTLIRVYLLVEGWKEHSAHRGVKNRLWHVGDMIRDPFAK